MFNPLLYTGKYIRHYPGKYHILLLLATIVCCQARAQNISSKHLSDSHKEYYDSLAKMNYNRVFPILGDKVYKRGFDIPFPFGVMINSFYGSQGITISNIKVGIKGTDTALGPVDLSDVIEFSDVTAKGYNVNTRVDLWVLPFLNVYGMLNWFPRASTSVSLSKPVELSTKATQHGWAWGLGIMGAGGVGPVWIQADYNMTWADMELLDNKVFTQIVGIRMGHAFTSHKNAERNISLWIGMMGMFINNNTVGQIALSDIFPGMTQEQIDNIKNSYNNWYDDLSAVKQKVVDKIVENLQDRIDGHPVKDTYITYQMNKSVKSRWAGLVGAQYQVNKRWQIRTECNFIGKDRFSLLTSLNYRFMGFKKKTKAD
ncbi:MAG: hypothetical protein QM731_07305 [Chitinophagaceae bacterium]